MEDRYFIIDIFIKDGNESNIETTLPDKLMTHDELLEKYMETFIDYMTPEIIAQMSDEELGDEINIWESNLEEYTCDCMKTAEVYQISGETFEISKYEIPVDKMVEYVRQWSDKQ